MVGAATRRRQRHGKFEVTASVLRSDCPVNLGRAGRHPKVGVIVVMTGPIALSPLGEIDRRGSIVSRWVRLAWFRRAWFGIPIVVPGLRNETESGVSSRFFVGRK